MGAQTFADDGGIPVVKGPVTKSILVIDNTCYRTHLSVVGPTKETQMQDAVTIKNNAKIAREVKESIAVVLARYVKNIEGFPTQVRNDSIILYADAPRSWYQQVNGHDVSFLRKEDGKDIVLKVSHQEFPMQVRLLLPHTENEDETISAYEPEWNEDAEDPEVRQAAFSQAGQGGVITGSAVREGEENTNTRKRKRKNHGVTATSQTENNAHRSNGNGKRSRRAVGSGIAASASASAVVGAVNTTAQPSFGEVYASMMREPLRNLEERYIKGSDMIDADTVAPEQADTKIADKTKSTLSLPGNQQPKQSESKTDRMMSRTGKGKRKAIVSESDSDDNLPPPSALSVRKTRSGRRLEESTALRPSVSKGEAQQMDASSYGHDTQQRKEQDSEPFSPRHTRSGRTLEQQLDDDEADGTAISRIGRRVSGIFRQIFG